MNRRFIYAFSWIVFFLIWGVFGFAAAGPRGEPDLAATVPPVETAVVIPDPTDLPGVPITGKPEPVSAEVLVFYGLSGLTALFLILAMLNLANRSTAPFVEQKALPSDERRRD